MTECFLGVSDFLLNDHNGEPEEKNTAEMVHDFRLTNLSKFPAIFDFFWFFLTLMSMSLDFFLD